MADCVDREDIEFLFTEDDVDDESLLMSLSMIESQNSDELEDVESELDSVWNDIEERKDSVYKCGHCGKVCKSHGGLKLHSRKKHQEVNESAKPDYDKMASDKLTPPLLEKMINEILSELSNDDCYPTGMQKAFKDTQIKVSCDHAIYKECTKCLAFMYKKNDPESFYEKFYSSLPLQAETLLNKSFPESFCKVVVLHLGDKLLAFSKPSSNQSCVEISLKDAERGPLNYLGGYILRNLYRKHQTKSSKETNICEEKEEFMALLDSLHVDEPTAKDSAFISAKDRGGLWYPKEYLTDILVTAELQFRVQSGKEVCHKICVDKVVDILLQKPVLRSKWNMLVEECGCKITKGRSIIFLDQILSLFIKIRSFSYAKDIVQKYKLQQKATRKKGLRKEIKRATNPTVQV